MALIVLVWGTAVTVGLVAWVGRSDPSTGSDQRIAVPPSPSAPESSDPETPKPPSSKPSSPEPERSERSSRSDPPKKKKKKPEIPTAGTGKYERQQTSAKPASDRGQTITYDVRVEKDLPYDAADVAKTIHEILNDERSWTGTGEWRFELVTPDEDADLHAYLATPETTDRLCAPLLTGGELSCRNESKIVLNARRWAFGADAYGDDIKNYRRYLVNHEFGHALGFGHVSCPGEDRPAPIMMQQTKGLDGCKPNPWPDGDDD